MDLIKCPSCNSHMSFKMDYNCGNPIVVYTCENCKYTTFGESYITDNKTSMTVGSRSLTTNNTNTSYELLDGKMRY